MTYVGFPPTNFSRTKSAKPGYRDALVTVPSDADSVRKGEVGGLLTVNLNPDGKIEGDRCVVCMCPFCQ